MQASTIDSVITQAETLNNEDQLIFLDLFQKRLNDRRRDEIANNGKITLEAIKQKKAKIGSVEDFLKDLGKD